MKRALLFILAVSLGALPSLAQDGSAAAVRKALHSSSFKNVQATVENGAATLTGTVDLYSTKMLAEQQVSRVTGLTGIRDEVTVTTPAIPDTKLQTELQNAIAYHFLQTLGHLPDDTQRIGVFVQNGIVTLSGRDANPLLASIAFVTSANTAGVTSVLDNIQRKPGTLPLQNWPAVTGVSQP